MTARSVNLNLRVDVIGRFRMVKNKARDDVESTHVHGAPLKRTAEWIKCVSRAIIYQMMIYHRPGDKRQLKAQDVTAKYCIYDKVPCRFSFE